MANKSNIMSKADKAWVQDKWVQVIAAKQGLNERSSVSDSFGTRLKISEMNTAIIRLEVALETLGLIK